MLRGFSSILRVILGLIRMFKTISNGISPEAIPFVIALLLISTGSASAQEKKPEALNVAYTSATATRAPLWIAKEMGLFEKYGVDIRLIYIRAGSPSISALVSGVAWLAIG